MQGKKDYQEKLFSNFQLSERIPENNFYRRLKSAMDLDFLYNLTKGYYGVSGRKSKGDKSDKGQRGITASRMS